MKEEVWREGARLLPGKDSRAARGGRRKLSLSQVRLAQGFLEDVHQGVHLASISGQGSRSAVFLVHAEGLRQAPGGAACAPSGVYRLRTGCYHTGSVQVL